jgi:hypothetical protein
MWARFEGRLEAKSLGECSEFAGRTLSLGPHTESSSTTTLSLRCWKLVRWNTSSCVHEDANCKIGTVSAQVNPSAPRATFASRTAVPYLHQRDRGACYLMVRAQLQHSQRRPKGDKLHEVVVLVSVSVVGKAAMIEKLKCFEVGEQPNQLEKIHAVARGS